MQSIIEGNSIWILKVKLLDREGYTLWSNAGEIDVLISIAQSVLFFKSRRALHDFVLSGIECNLSASSDYILLQNTTVEWHEKENIQVTKYNLNQPVKLLSNSNPTKWAKKTRANILNCCNLVWDMANTVNDQWS